jgi:hypothetical protein
MLYVRLDGECNDMGRKWACRCAMRPKSHPLLRFQQPATFLPDSDQSPRAEQRARVRGGGSSGTPRVASAAALMLKRYGDRALEESASRADELASAGDDNGVAVWRRISDAVGQFVNTTPPGPVH